MEKIYDLVKKSQAEGRVIYIRGITHHGIILGTYFDSQSIPFDGYISNNPEKWGSTVYGGHKCFSPEEVNKNSFVFITAYKVETEKAIAAEVEAAGIPCIFGIHDELYECAKYVDSEIFLKALFQWNMEYPLDLENPKTLCEKLQWLKLYHHDPIYTTMVDKYGAKKYVASVIGEEHIIPTLGVWDSVDDINFDCLPNRFILKHTHNSGYSLKVEDKATLDLDVAKQALKEGFSRNYFYMGREWPYKNVKPRIIAEPYIDSLGKLDSVEYKVTCFGGEVGFVTICRGIAHDSFDKRTNDHFTPEFERLDWWVNYKPSSVKWEKPKQWNEIIEISEKLSAGIPYVRVDLYILDGRVYFGEMTFYTWGGLMRFNPPEWDRILGDMLTLPEKKS